MLSLTEFYGTKDWIKVLGLVLIALVYSNAILNIFTLFLHLTFISLILMFARSINNFYGAIKEGEKNYVFLAIKKHGKKKVKMLVFLPLIISLLFLPYYISSTLSFISAIFLIFLSYSYSSPPFRLRNKKYFDIIWNVVGAVSIFSTIFLFHSSPNILFFFFVFYVAWFYFVSEILHQLSHYNKDYKLKRITTCISLGKEKMLFILKNSFILSTILSTIFLLALKRNPFFLPIIFIFFNCLRYRRIFGSANQDFEKLRTRIYGVEEGLTYLILGILLKILNLALI